MQTHEYEREILSDYFFWVNNIMNKFTLHPQIKRFWHFVPLSIIFDTLYLLIIKFWHFTPFDNFFSLILIEINFLASKIMILPL